MRVDTKKILKQIIYRMTGNEDIPLAIQEHEYNEYIEQYTKRILQCEKYHRGNNTKACNPRQIQKLRRLYMVLTEGRELLEYKSLIYLTCEEADIHIKQFEKNLKEKNPLATKGQLDELERLFNKLTDNKCLDLYIDKPYILRSEADMLIDNWQRHEFNEITDLYMHTINRGIS